MWGDTGNPRHSWLTLGYGSDVDKFCQGDKL